MIPVIITISALTVATVIFLIAMYHNKKNTAANEQEYIQMFSSLYLDNSVVDSLEQIREKFKKGSAEYIAVDKAIFYLTKSIARDYQTAFTIIEKVFACDEVKKMHMAVIEQEKANIMYLLPEQPKKVKVSSKRNKKRR